MMGPIASKQPYRVFDYYEHQCDPASEELRTCYMVSTLTLPQHPVALCGPDHEFADALCDLLNATPSPPPVEPEQGGWAMMVVEYERVAAVLDHARLGLLTSMLDDNLALERAEELGYVERHYEGAVGFMGFSKLYLTPTLRIAMNGATP